MAIQSRSLMQLTQGATPLQAHRNLTPGHKEEELTRQGFDGRSTVFYRHGDPTSYRSTGHFRSTSVDGNALVTGDLKSPDGLPQRLYFNADCTIWLSRRAESMPWFRRNVDGDECWFVHQGSGTVETEYGDIPFAAGDYVYLPKGATHRWRIDQGVFLLGVETRDELQVPTYAGLGRHAPFDTDLIRTPQFKPPVLEEGEFEVKVKYDQEYSSLMFANHPFDVYGWKGDLFPFAFNIEDWNVLMSDSLHIPPTMAVFMCTETVNIINLLPRPLERKPGTERVPWYHRNADYDEVHLMHGGRKQGTSLQTGRIDHDPQGINHGVSEDDRQTSRNEWDSVDYTDWSIIMIEAKNPVRLDPDVPADIVA